VLVLLGKVLRLDSAHCRGFGPLQRDLLKNKVRPWRSEAPSRDAVVKRDAKGSEAVGWVKRQVEPVGLHVACPQLEKKMDVRVLHLRRICWHLLCMTVAKLDAKESAKSVGLVKKQVELVGLNVACPPLEKKMDAKALHLWSWCESMAVKVVWMKALKHHWVALLYLVLKPW